MRKLLRRFVDFVLGLIPLALYRRLFPRPAVGIFYHSVTDDRLPHQVHTYPSEPVARFEAALRYIKQDFNPVNYQQLEDHYERGALLPPRALHLSFDDGFAECYEVVRPLLLKHGIPCTFFVVTDWLDDHQMFYRHKQSLAVEHILGLDAAMQAEALAAINREFELDLLNAGAFATWAGAQTRAEDEQISRAAHILSLDLDAYLNSRQLYLSTQQLRQMHAEGFTIGAHTRSHWKLAALETAEQRADEVLESARAVAALTGQQRVPFAFPYSGTGVERAELAALRENNPLLGLIFDTQKLQPDAPFIVQRIWAEQSAYRSAGRRTNLPVLLHDAYRQEAWRAIHRFWEVGVGTRD